MPTEETPNQTELPIAEAPAAETPVAEAAPTAEAPTVSDEAAIAALEAGLKAEAGEAPEPADPEAEVTEETPTAEAETVEEEAPPLSPEDEAKSLGVKNERARERFVSLRNTVDEQAKKIEALSGKAERAEQLIGHFEATGATPEQTGTVLTYLAAVNRGDISALTNAYDVLSKELEWLGEKIGRAPPGKSLVDTHADLKEAVANGDIDAARAEELAQLRARTRAVESHTQQQHLTAQQVAAQNQAIENGKQQLNALETRLSKDPQYKAKFEQIMATEGARIRDLPPDRWAVEFELAYLRIPATPTPPPPPPKPPVGHVPLRPQGNGGGMGRVASSPLEALEMGLAAADAANR